jgi:NAD(P)-dependent dehydrogenase (short-subunit alcohol dehydrogenase family)
MQPNVKEHSNASIRTKDRRHHGGSSGIGLATSKRFVKEGEYVFITGGRKAELDKAAAEIGSKVTAVKGDVANPNDLDRLYQTVAAKKGPQDILFANAGIADPVTGRISC